LPSAFKELSTVGLVPNRVAIPEYTLLIAFHSPPLAQPIIAFDLLQLDDQHIDIVGASPGKKIKLDINRNDDGRGYTATPSGLAGI